jgi:ribosomal protein L24
VGIRIKKGDLVEVIAGDDKGERGTVARVLPKVGRVVVQGVNLVKKAQRRARRGAAPRHPLGSLNLRRPSISPM